MVYIFDLKEVINCFKFYRNNGFFLNLYLFEGLWVKIIFYLYIDILWDML